MTRNRLPRPPSNIGDVRSTVHDRLPPVTHLVTTKPHPGKPPVVHQKPPARPHTPHVPKVHLAKPHHFSPFAHNHTTHNPDGTPRPGYEELSIFGSHFYARIPAGHPGSTLKPKTPHKPHTTHLTHHAARHAANTQTITTPAGTITAPLAHAHTPHKPPAHHTSHTARGHIGNHGTAGVISRALQEQGHRLTLAALGIHPAASTHHRTQPHQLSAAALSHTSANPNYYHHPSTHVGTHAPRATAAAASPLQLTDASFLGHDSRVPHPPHLPQIHSTAHLTPHSRGRH